MDVVWPIATTGAEVGNFLGYATANRQLAAALQRNGVRLHAPGEQPASCRIALHFMFPDAFVPVPGVKNFLFTMFENNDTEAILEIFAPAFARTDAIIAPSRWCARLFGHYTGKPIETCPLGIDVEAFPYLRRRWRGPQLDGPFIWLYVGAPNRRKWTILPDLWEGFLAGFSSGFTHLYLKTTGVDWEPALKRMRKSGAQVNLERLDFPEGSVYLTDDVTVDNRLLPRERLAPEVYHRAHAQLFLHCGEGWGLTGLEGMATGLPLVVSDSTGTQDYANDENSFPVKCVTRDVRLVGEDKEGVHLDMTARLPWPDDLDAVTQMGKVMRDYHRASVIARRGSHVAHSFTWDRAAIRVLEILRHPV